MGKILVLMVGILLATVYARAEITDAQYNYCLKTLATEPFVSPDWIEPLCARFPMTVLGCAIDMYQRDEDMYERGQGTKPDYIGEVEYCAEPGMPHL